MATHFLTGGGELGAMVRDHDWAATPLGPPEQWPTALRLASSLCLGSRFPMLLSWGPELTMLYNDGYAPLLAAKHPAALGRPVREVWHEVWDDVGPLFEGVMATGEPVFFRDWPLTTQRRGFDEETYSTFSYSPVFDEEGRVAGVLNTVSETTEEVLARRRLATLARLTSHEEDWRTVARDVVAALEADAVDLPFAVLELAGTAVAGYGTATERTERFSIAEVDDGPLELVLGLGPLVRFDDPYFEFLELAAAAIAVCVRRAVHAGAQRRAAEEERDRLQEHAERLERLLEREHQIVETLQRSLLPPAISTSNRVDVAARYAPAHDAPRVGGDWYDASTLADGTLVLTVGDVAGHGLDAAATMGHLRSSTRALARDASGPGELLRRLNGLAMDDASGTMATCLVAFVEADGATVRLASAGHPPALAGHPARELTVSPGYPLGVSSDADYETTTHELGAGARLLLYTDGVIERRGESLLVGLERLRALLDTLEGGADAIAQAVLDGSRPAAGWGDDAAVLVARVG